MITQAALESIDRGDAILTLAAAFRFALTAHDGTLPPVGAALGGEPPLDIARPFLSERTPRPLALPRQGGLVPKALHIGNGQNAFEVAVVDAASQPSVGALQTAWKARRGGRASPVLVVALYGDRVALCGPAGDDPPVLTGIDRGQAERLCRAALDQPDRHTALAFLAQALPSLDTLVPGLRNEGLFALHALTVDAQRRPEWTGAADKVRRIAARKGQDLLAGLGFNIERIDNLTLLLRGGERRAALAVLLDPAEIPEAGMVRFNNLSPVSYALAKADAEGLPWVVVLHGDRIRLYPTEVGIGVGRRGRTETYVELQTSLLADEHLPYLWLLFSADGLDPKRCGSFRSRTGHRRSSAYLPRSIILPSGQQRSHFRHQRWMGANRCSDHRENAGHRSGSRNSSDQTENRWPKNLLPLGALRGGEGHCSGSGTTLRQSLRGMWEAREPVHAAARVDQDPLRGAPGQQRKRRMKQAHKRHARSSTTVRPAVVVRLPLIRGTSFLAPPMRLC